MSLYVVKNNFKIIEAELAKYSENLYKRPRWLILNKVDLLPKDKIEVIKTEVVNQLNWQKPIFAISGVTKHGTEDLINAIWQSFNQNNGD